MLDEATKEVLIEEHRSLRQEMVFHIRHLDAVFNRAVIIVATVYGVALSGALPVPWREANIPETVQQAFALLPILVVIVSWMEFHSSLQIIRQIGEYIRRTEGRMLHEGVPASDPHALGWQSFLGEGEAQLDRLNRFRAYRWAVLLAGCICFTAFFFSTV